MTQKEDFFGSHEWARTTGHSDGSYGGEMGRLAHEQEQRRLQANADEAGRWKNLNRKRGPASSWTTPDLLVALLFVCVLYASFRVWEGYREWPYPAATFLAGLGACGLLRTFLTRTWIGRALVWVVDAVIVIATVSAVFYLIERFQ